MVKSRRIFCLLATCLILPAMAARAATSLPTADAGWSRVEDKFITAYTQGDPAQASAIIHSFAELGNAFSQASAFHPTLDASLTVIVFGSEKQFNQYRLNPGSSALYQQTSRGDYIVLQTRGPAHQEVSRHEFTHFLIAHSGMALPLWLNEGLADFYSTFAVSGDQVTFGAPVSGRLSILRSSTWLPLQRLLEVGADSPDYTDPRRMVMFYSESWILAHMLLTDPAYAEKFPRLLGSLAEGHSPSESFAAIYGKSPSQVEQDLREHLTPARLATIEARIKPLTAAPPTASASSVSNTQMEIKLADLTVTDPASSASVETRLAAVASQSPESPAAEESLGFLALRQGKEQDARTHFRLAVARNSNDPNVLFYLAHLDHEAGVPASQTIPYLERALKLKPALNDALLELGLQQAGDGKFEDALTALRKLPSARPENAYVAAYTVAYCYANMDQIEEARAAVQRAKSLAANDHDRAELIQLSQFIDERAQ